LEFKILAVAEDKSASLKGGMGEIRTQGLSVELKQPRGCDGIFVAEDEGKALKNSVRFGSNFPGSCLSGAPQALFRSKK
jgi:hypothetical protein